MKKIFAVCLILLAPFATAAAECTREEAYAAETVVDYLDSWGNVHIFYKQFRHCYDGGIAEGVQDRIQQLWADHWGDLPQMIALTKRDPPFNEFVLRSLTTEAFPQDTFKRVVRNARTRCPAVARSFCKAVLAEAAKSRMGSNMSIESGPPTAAAHLHR
jgi:capsid protein